MFTLVAVIGSVLLALWSQRREFNRREAEMKSAFEAQEQAPRGPVGGGTWPNAVWR